MNAERVPDAVVDAIEVSWNDVGHFRTRVDLPEGSDDQKAVLRIVATLRSWDDARFLAEGVARRESRATDTQGFSYPLPRGATDVESATQFEGVKVFDGLGRTLIVGEVSFDRLMARTFGLLVGEATARHDPVTGETWWPDFVSQVEEVQARASSREG